MIPAHSNEFKNLLEEWSQERDSIRQNNLLDESSFIKFVNERGVEAWGVISGDPGDFCKRGWLTSDGTTSSDGQLFHPFRIFTLFKTLETCKLNVAQSSTLRRASVLGVIEKVMATLPSDEKIGEMARHWNKIIDLAILLEPVYWPVVTGKIRFCGHLRDEAFDAAMDKYRLKVLQLVGTLDPAYWRGIHRALRVDAHRVDSNDRLYLLLRLSDWDRRDDLKGHIGCALWFRHIAEVIRRAFEEVHSEQWPEEDEAAGTWFQGARIMTYGSERPLDDVIKSQSYLAFEFGLFTGSVVRWYVEGETEYYAIRRIILDPAKSGIELVNLRGNIKSGKGNIALKLRDCLNEDLALRRFSMISIDADVPENVKTVRLQVEQKRVVGFITANRPDFEFSNFAVEELAEVAARIDESNGFCGDSVRKADWAGVCSGSAFEKKYREISAGTPAGLKGQVWGGALAAFALEHQKRSDNDNERPFWLEIQAAFRARVANYDFQKDHYGFNVDTFESVEVMAAGIV